MNLEEESIEYKADIEEENIEKKEEYTEDYSIETYDISVLPNDFNISTIFSYIENNIFQIPKFQRNYVWDIAQASKLIESILLDLPIPQIFLYQIEKNKFYIIDGQQRLLTLYFFMKGKFPKSSERVSIRKGFEGEEELKEIMNDKKLFVNFKLKLGEHNLYKDKSYENYKDDITFSMKTMRCVVIKQNNPQNHSSIYEIFNRLNTGGTKLKAQEIRSSLYNSELYSKMEELNNSKQWREIIGRAKKHLHQKDLEMILRCFAMSYDNFFSKEELKKRSLKEYSGKVVTFLNDFSNYGKEKMTKLELEELSDFFKLFIERIYLLKSDIFKNERKVFSYMKLEAIFVSSYKIKKNSHLTNLDFITLDRLNTILKDIEFTNTTKHSSTRKDFVVKRREIAFRVLNVLGSKI